MLVIVLGVLELLAGSYALRAALVHRAAYPETWQYLFDLTWAGMLALCGLGLLRRRRWAGLMTTALLFLAFFGMLAALALLYAPGRWWYWLLPPALPLLGWAIQVMRRERHAFLRSW